MMSKATLCLAVCSPVSILLQGCGGGGSTSTGAPSPPSPPPTGSTTTSPGASTSTIAATTTTTSFTTRTPGWTAAEAVAELNAMYMAFNESDDSTALGVTISFAGQTSSFEANLYCHGYVNTDCHNGNNDCRMSGAVLNHQVSVEQSGDGWRFVPVMGRPIGYVFNQSLSENYFGKCAFLYDGADSYNVNVGCGASAPAPQDCSNELSAFYDMCTDGGTHDPHHCIATDSEVVSKKCKCESCSPTYGTVTPPQQKSEETCFYELPALIVDPDNVGAFTPSSTNHLRDSMKQRVAGDNITRQQREWNEIVIDDRLLIPKINEDPTHTIVAFVYSGSETNKNLAIAMRDTFQQTYRVSGVPDIPVIEIDAEVDFTTVGGPFKLPSQSRVVV